MWSRSVKMNNCICFFLYVRVKKFHRNKATHLHCKVLTSIDTVISLVHMYVNQLDSDV